MLEPERITRAQRELRALCRDVGENDPEAFAEMVHLADWLRDELLPEAARAQVQRGYSWADVARPLGVTRQWAWQRFCARAEASGISAR